MTLVRGLLKAQLSAGLRSALRNVQTEMRIQRLHREGLTRAKRLAGVRPLRLNLGSGLRPRAGWVNVDLRADADLPLDLRERLPFGDGTVEEIYSEHFFEHLDYPNLGDTTAWHLESASRTSDALAFLRECRRVLVPGGRLDVVVPDAECILREYVAWHDRRSVPPSWWGPAWCDTAMHRVNYVFRQGREHKYAYDAETLRRVLESVGFTAVRRRPFNPATDADNHALGSLCMEAMSPAADMRARAS